MLPYNTNLDIINSLTKYPSIDTYHTIGDRGLLLETYTPFRDSVVLTEKIDGTNARIVLFCCNDDDDVFIGSREDLLWAKEDRIGVPVMGIVDSIRETAERVSEHFSSTLHQDGDMLSKMYQSPPCIFVIYGEVYGGKVGKYAKDYTSDKSKTGFRMFDVAIIDEWRKFHDGGSASEASIWRQNVGPRWLDELCLQEFSNIFGLELTPRIETSVSIPPCGIEETLDWLKWVAPNTQAALDDDARGNCEGVVVRTPDRSMIRKIRFEDYERTIRKMATT